MKRKYLKYLLFGLSMSCGTQDPAVSNLNEMSQEQRANIDSVMEHLSEVPGWPSMPRKTGTFTQNTSNNASFSVGLEGKLFGTGGGVTTKVTFEVNVTSSLVLIKHDPDGSARLTKQSTNGLVLDYQTGSEYVGMCTYEISLSASSGIVGSLSLFGSGFSDTQSFRRTTAINSSSRFYNIAPGMKVDHQLEHCAQEYRLKVRDAVLEELKDLALNMKYKVGDESCVVPQKQGILPNSHPGDVSCFHPGADFGIKAPRCMLDMSQPMENIGRCQWRGLEGSPCPVYQSSGKQISFEPVDETSRLASDGQDEFYCDTGHKCEVDQEGGWFRGWSLYSYYQASCKKI